MTRLVTLLVIGAVIGQLFIEDMVVKIDDDDRVLVSRFGEFGTICADNWGDTEAAVTCRSLGYENGYYQRPVSSSSNNPRWLYNVSCSADAMTLSDCSFSLEPTNGNCGGDARVYCFSSFNAHTYSLSGGSNSNYGYVYVTHQNKTGVLCSQRLSSDRYATKVLCQSLGYLDGVLDQGNSSELHTSNAWDLYVSYCYEQDRRLEMCMNSRWSFLNLDDSSSTTCKNNLAKVFCYRSVRLHWSYYSPLGIVIASTKSGLTAICEDSLDNYTADVVCRELHFTNGGFALGYNPFPTATYAYKMQDLSCEGTEKSLLDCNYTEVTSAPCPSETPGVVVCQTDTEIIKELKIKLDSDGRVLVSRYGVYGTICSDGWGDTEAVVTCTSLGYDNGYYQHKYSSSSNVPRWLYNVSCSAGDMTLSDCFFSLEATNGNCGGDARVYCFSSFNAHTYSLSGGSQSNYGYVYVTHQNKTGVLCSQSLSSDRYATKVLCQSLGYLDGLLDQGNSSEIDTSNAWDYYVSYCYDQDRRLEMCRNSRWSFVNLAYGSSTTCKSNLAKVFCFRSVRLHRSNYSPFGIVIASTNSGLSAICQDSLDNNTADVVCRELHFTNGGFALGYTPFPTGSYAYKMQDLSCEGTEKSLLDCNYTEVTRAPCPSETPGVVVCQTDTEMIKDYKTKLDNDGRVMVSRYGEFGTICSDGWGDTEAAVTCRSLGYDNGFYQRPLSSSLNNPRWLYNVSCSAGDITLSNCSFSLEPTNGNCGVDARVYCFSSFNAHTYSLSGRSQSNYGYVYVTHQNKTGVLCSQRLYATYALCQSLGYLDGVLDQGNSSEIDTSNAWYLYVSYCYNTDRRLEMCSSSRWSFVNLDDSSSTYCKNNLAKVFCYRSVHLHKTFYSPIGIVLITTDYRDSAICQDSFDKNAADVVCRELHFLGGGLVLGFNPYPTSYSNMINDLSCEGTEKSLVDCNYTETYSSNCPSRTPAVVACRTEKKEDMQVNLRADDRVVVKFYGIHGTVCAEGWTDKEASVVCRHLGYDAGNATQLERDSALPVWLYDVSCGANAESLLDCRYSTCCNCQHDAGVQCYNQTEDVDECRTGAHNCDASHGVCSNTDESFTCSCATGFTGDGVTCSDVDECTTGAHNCDASHGVCKNINGSFTCSCVTGFTGDGVTCSDLDECTTGAHNCDASHGVCKNINGSFTCSCVTGFTGDGVTCSDLDECTTGAHNCDASHGVCKNINGSFTCSCVTGLTGDGVTCSDLDECTTGAHNCDASNGVCKNINGSFTCSCVTGFTGDGVTCSDLDECTTGAHNCDASHGVCKNINGSFTCSCVTGFTGDGVTCSGTCIIINKRNTDDTELN